MKSNEFDEASENEENLREYFQKELDIAIANEKRDVPSHAVPVLMWPETEHL